MIASEKKYSGTHLFAESKRIFRLCDSEKTGFEIGVPKVAGIRFHHHE